MFSTSARIDCRGEDSEIIRYDIALWRKSKQRVQNYPIYVFDRRAKENELTTLFVALHRNCTHEALGSC
jgi:hypothetical protein